MRFTKGIIAECSFVAIVVCMIVYLPVGNEHQCIHSDVARTMENTTEAVTNTPQPGPGNITGSNGMEPSSCGDFPSWKFPIKQEKWVQCKSQFVKNHKSTQGLSFVSSSQEMALQILNKTLGNITKVILMDLANFENKGDPGMGLGEFHLMKKLNKQVVFYCEYRCQAPVDWIKPREIIDEVGAQNIAVLAHGGGNIGAYPERDFKRFEIMTYFPDVKFVVLSQSVFFKDKKHLEFAAMKYQSHKDITMLLRNQFSYQFIRHHMPKVKSILAPDMAYGIGHINRFMDPIYDVLVIHRTDREAMDHGNFTFPPEVTVSCLDWHQPWRTPKADNLVQQLHFLSYNGLFYLQRGRVLITDRLHGHIFATLMDNYPVVLLDNQFHKLQDFRDTWTSGLETVETAHSSEEAVQKAMMLLHKFYPRPYSQRDSFKSGLLRKELS